MKKEQKDDFVNGWMNEIRAGLEYRQRFSTRSKWDVFRKYYRGQWVDGLVSVNKVFSYGRMLMPQVYFRAPRVTVTASRPDLVWHAKVVEAIDNLLIRQTLLKNTLKKAILDAYLCGVGPIKLGFDSEFGYLAEQVVEDDGATATQYSRKENRRIEYHQNIKPGMPWALRVRPEDVVVPWGASDPDNLPWVAHYILRPLDDVKSDQKYRNTEHLQGTRTPQIEKLSETFRPRFTQEKGVVYAELWEVRDVRTGQIFVFCEGNLLMAADDVLQRVSGMPWEFVMFNPDPEYFWAIPDVAIIEPQQLELNETVTQAAKHRAIALLKFLYRRGAMTREELEKFLSGEVGPAVAVEDDIASAVLPLQPHVPPDFYRDAQVQIQAMREELGFSQNQEGAFSPYHGKTASETMVVAQAFENRVNERRDTVADILVNIVRKWNWMLFEFWTEERVVQIVTPEGKPAWVSYTGDQLRGEYMLSIDAESGMALTRALKYQMAAELFKAFGGDQLIDQVLLRQIVLDSFSAIDPRIPQLLQTEFGGVPEVLAAQRQPGPQQRAMSFDEFRRAMSRGVI